MGLPRSLLCCCPRLGDRLVRLEFCVDRNEFVFTWMNIVFMLSPEIKSKILINSTKNLLSKGRVKKNRGGAARLDFPLKKNKKHGLSTLDFA